MTELETLYLEYCRLTELNVRNNKELRELYCSHNNLSNLDVTCNVGLTHLYVWYNDLTALDLSNNADLTYLGAGYNPDLKTLDISLCRKLTHLDTDVRGVYVWEGFNRSSSDLNYPETSTYVIKGTEAMGTAINDKIKDPVFLSLLIDMFDFDEDGIITDRLVSNVTLIYTWGEEYSKYSNIKSLSGIEYLPV